jgi:hypothetical protein
MVSTTPMTKINAHVLELQGDNERLDPQHGEVKCQVHRLESLC